MRQVPAHLPASLAGREFVRFAIVGGLNVIISFAVFYLCYRILSVATLLMDAAGPAGRWLQEKLTELGVKGIDAAFANGLGYLAGMINSFLLNRRWTFQAAGCPLRQANRFVILNILGLLLSSLMIFLFVDLLAGPYMVIWLITVGAVMVLNYFGNKHWTFTDRSPVKGMDAPCL